MSEEVWTGYHNPYSLAAQRESGTPTEVSDLVHGLEPLKQELNELLDPEEVGPVLGWFAEDANDNQFNVCLCCGYPFHPVDGSEAADNPIRLEYCDKCAYSRCDVSTDEYRSGHCPKRLGRRAAK